MYRGNLMFRGNLVLHSISVFHGILEFHSICGFLVVPSGTLCGDDDALPFLLDDDDGDVLVA